MKFLFLGDIVGRSGRDAVIAALPRLREEHALDFITVCGDNAAGGFGITGDICKDLFKAGADVVTGGDHIWDQKDISSYLAKEKRLLRPANFPERTPGRGHNVYEAKNGKRVLVLHLLGQVFLREHTQCPFATADKVLETIKLKRDVDVIMVDMHAEATSEKMAIGKYLDGRVSMVVGGHTHVPTADARVLPKGTAYHTDAGMCGDYDSVIGFAAAGPLERFLTKIPRIKMEPASGEATVCGTLVETDDKTGLAKTCRVLQYPKALSS